MERLDLRLVDYFVAVAEELHFGRAAERLHIAQPSLSQQIRRLEQQLGVTLLERNSRNVRLTRAGEAFLREGRRALAQAQRAISATRAAAAELLTVGFYGSAGKALLPLVLTALHERQPVTEVSVREILFARAAHSPTWVKRQTRALGRFLIRAGQAIARELTLIQQSQPALSVPFPGLTPANLKRAGDYVRAHGLPQSVVLLERKDGISHAQLIAFTQKLESAVGLPNWATSIYGLVSYAPLITAEQKAANALQTYGQLLLATS